MRQFLIAFDQLINTLVFIKGDGFGYADETLSARAWRLRNEISLYKYIDILFRPLEAEHCKKSYINELIRHQLHPYYSKNEKYESCNAEVSR